jgi:trehalose utilization protein
MILEIHFRLPAPIINIQDGQGSNYIIAGHEPYSQYFGSKVFQITNNNVHYWKSCFYFWSSFENISSKLI